MNESISETARRHREAMMEALGDPEAVRFCESFFFITQIWDDLVDGDKQRDIEDVNRAFWLSLVEMPANAFYLRHAAHLNAFIAQAACAWFDANTLETGTTHDKTLAFVLRDAVGGLISHCAYLLGGYEWMRSVSPDLRRLAHEEPLGKYLRGLK
jgi:hypothetical protein